MTEQPRPRFVHRNGRLLSPSKDSRQQKVVWLERRATEVDDGECRDWPWAMNNKGYAMIRWNGETRKAGHVVLELSGQPRPEGAQQLHSCDRPSCVARWHLRWGSNRENVGEKMTRGRHTPTPGEANGVAKLTDDIVREIRSSTETNVALAARYGVHKTVIGKVRRGVTWGHVA